jgi:hypothetical protein
VETIRVLSCYLAELKEREQDKKASALAPAPAVCAPKYAPDVVAPAMMFNQSTKSVDLVNQLSIADGGEDHTAIAVGEGGATGTIGYVLRGLSSSRTSN